MSTSNWMVSYSTSYLSLHICYVLLRLPMMDAVGVDAETKHSQSFGKHRGSCGLPSRGPSNSSTETGSIPSPELPQRQHWLEKYTLSSRQIKKRKQSVPRLIMRIRVEGTTHTFSGWRWGSWLLAPTIWLSRAWLHSRMST